MDERENYGYGYSPCGERFYDLKDLKSGRRQGRINMIAGYRDGQLIAPFTVEGSCNRTVFESWLETCLIPVLRPGEWVIVDNATFPERRSHCPSELKPQGVRSSICRPIHQISIVLKSVGQG